MTTESKMLDELVEQAMYLSATRYAHADLQETRYGVALVIRDEDPAIGPGEVITAGYGRTESAAIVAANSAMKPRSALSAR